MMRSALDAVSDKFRNFNTSLRTAVPGSIPLETVQGTDHPLAEPQPPSVPYDDPQLQPQPRPRINGISSKGQGQGVRTSVESQRDGADGNVSGRASLDSEWCDLGPSTGSSRHGRGQVFNKRLLHFQAELLAGGSIDMANVRALAFDGVPDRDGLRAIIWKVHMPRPLNPDPPHKVDIISLLCDPITLHPHSAAVSTRGSEPLATLVGRTQQQRWLNLFMVSEVRRIGAPDGCRKRNVFLTLTRFAHMVVLAVTRLLATSCFAKIHTNVPLSLHSLVWKGTEAVLKLPCSYCLGISPVTYPAGQQISAGNERSTHSSARCVIR